MIYGSDSTRRPAPRQDPDKVLLLASRFQRDKAALDAWAETAKRCVDYSEGRQWAAADLAKLRREGRPEITVNKIKPLIQLILGYHCNNRTEIRYLPGHDGSGSEATATALTHLAQQIAEASQLPYIDCEVFLDGILTGRGFYDCRLDFEDNLFGTITWGAVDPFSVYPDANGEYYDLNKGNHVSVSRLISPEEIEHWYGRAVLDLCGPWFQGRELGNLPVAYDGFGEITPERRFAQSEDDVAFSAYGGYWNDWIDRQRKAIRVFDMQHYVRCKRWFFVDLDTGDREAVPDGWGMERARGAIEYARAQGHALAMQQLPCRRLRWTHIIGDVIAFDDWSPYDSFTIVPFFPYFRRGVTRGLVHDLLSPQDEVNKRRSARINIISRASNGGWLVPKGSLSAQEREHLKMHGAMPGVLIEWDSKGGQNPPPKQIEAGVVPIAMTQLEQEAENDLKEISGINDAALGQVDKVVSGRNLEARQRQSLVGVETVMVNYSRSKELSGRKQLELIQQHYTEERVIRVIGKGNNPVQTIINQRTAEGIVNNVTIGRYTVAIDESPISRSFLEAQFEELMRMIELGMPIPDEFVIDASSFGRKDELVAAMKLAREQQAAAAAAQPPAGPDGGGSGGPGPRAADGGSLPAGPDGRPASPQLRVVGQ